MLPRALMPPLPSDGSPVRLERLHAIGSPNVELVGAALHSAELRQMAQSHAELHPNGELRIRMWQCFCLRFNRRYIVVCEACGRTPGATK